ncbi:DUF674 family protein [Senna tora]|uniref:DUF674 family protein n=1 Tax=Senna tora TaxID=362788 RepID=A0A834TPA1_9FABA|nr:DUF674 family protein [Senna tora]
MDSTATPKQISLRLMVDRERNRVLFAEAGKEFVDVLLSFLTLPLGTIARLVSKDSNLKAVRFGCISSLYDSVGNIDPEYFSTNTCKEMLLRPRNPIEAHCRNLKINIDDTEPTKYFICQNIECRKKQSVLLSTFRNQRCNCGTDLYFEVNLDSSLAVASEGFVQKMLKFVILDDLSVITIGDRYTTLGVLRSLGINYAPVELTVDITQNEVLDLLKCALLSKAALSEAFLHKKQNLEKTIAQESYCLIKEEKAGDEENKNVKLKVKLTVRKSNGKVTFAQVEKDFVDVLLSFLTLPVGAVEHILGGNSCFGCLSKLYTSVVDLNVKYLKSEKHKAMLINPGVAQQFKVNSEILNVHEVTLPQYSCYTKYYYRNFTVSNLSSLLVAARPYSPLSKIYNDYELYSTVTLVDPKCLMKGESNNDGRFVEGPSMFMVTDDLVVKPFSLISAVSYLNESNVGEDDLEELIIGIGVKEVKAILKASMISCSALTTGLTSFLEKELKEFVDVLLSFFLTLPLGTIARLVSKDSNFKPLRFGCISSLYQRNAASAQESNGSSLWKSENKH